MTELLSTYKSDLYSDIRKKALTQYVGDLGTFIDLLGQKLTHSEVGKRGIELNCQDYRLHFCKAWYCSDIGKIDEAIYEIELAAAAITCCEGECQDNAEYHFVNNNLVPLRMVDKVYGKAGELYASVGNSKQSLYYYTLYQREKFKIKNEYYPFLFSFRSNSEYVLDEIKQNSITVCHPSFFNDPYDSLILPWCNNIIKDTQDKPHRKIFRQSYDYYRVRCFVPGEYHDESKPIRDMLMWSHYANSHKGLCVEYCFSESFIESYDIRRFRKVKYEESLEFDYESGEISSDLAFLTKNACWQYENEVRLLDYNVIDEDFPKLKLDNQSRIKAIYFGVNCPQDYIEKVKASLPYRGILLFKMRMDEKHIFSLKADSIENI